MRWGTSLLTLILGDRGLVHGAPSTTDAGPLALILEDMRDQFRVFGEGLTALSEKIRAALERKAQAEDVRRLDARVTELERRLGA